MRVLLIYPQGIALPGEIYFESMPLGLAYLAAVLEKEDHQVKIIDAQIEERETIKREDSFLNIGMSWQCLEEKIKDFNPEIVGISNLFSIQFPNVQKIAALIKKIKSIPVIVGGAHPSAAPEEVLKDKNIDFVIIGEGEYTLKDLLNCLQNRKDFGKLNGLAYKKENQVIIKPKTRYIEDLDELPFPARHLLPMKLYFRSQDLHSYYLKSRPYATVVTSRGCPGNCIFCSIHIVWGHTWRARSAEDVVDEIEFLAKEYGVREIHFEDDNITLDRPRMIQICQEIINRGIKVDWTTPNGVAVQTLDEELLIKMKESGCYHLFIGIESGNPQILHKVIRKNLSLNKALTIAKILKKLKIKTSAFFVFGVPGETKETIRDSINFAKKLDLDDVWFSIATPYPGTDLYRIAKEKGYAKLDEPVKLRPKLAVLNTPWLSEKDLEKLRNRAYLEFQLFKFFRHPLRYLTTKDNYKTWSRYVKYYIRTLIK